MVAPCIKFIISSATYEFHLLRISVHSVMPRPEKCGTLPRVPEANCTLLCWNPCFVSYSINRESLWELIKTGGMLLKLTIRPLSHQYECTTKDRYDLQISPREDRTVHFPQFCSNTLSTSGSSVRWPAFQTSSRVEQWDLEFADDFFVPGNFPVDPQSILDRIDLYKAEIGVLRSGYLTAVRRE